MPAFPFLSALMFHSIIFTPAVTPLVVNRRSWSSTAPTLSSSPTLTRGRGLLRRNVRVLGSTNGRGNWKKLTSDPRI